MRKARVGKQAYAPMAQMVKQDMKSGLIEEWGAYLGEGRGFGLAEGSEEAVDKMAQRYIPFVRFTTHPAAKVD